MSPWGCEKGGEGGKMGGGGIGIFSTELNDFEISEGGESFLGKKRKHHGRIIWMKGFRVYRYSLKYRIISLQNPYHLFR